MRWVALLVASVGVALAALSVGPGDLGDATLGPLFVELRALRMGAAFVAGAGLAVAGVLVQGLFRNPLASPSILGTTAGATLGGQLALVLTGGAVAAVPWAAPEMVLPLGCLAGATASLVVLLAFVRTGADRIVLVLVGFILSSLFLSLGSFLTSLAQGRYELGRAVVSFTLGGVAGAGPRHLLLALPLVLVGVGAAWAWGRSLDLFLSGEDEATTLGVDVPVVRRWSVVWAATLTAAAVALGGNVTFVGLVVPHALRPFFGVAHRGLVPAAAVAGGAFVVACDVLARVVPAQTEIPLGVVTGLVGAPLFLWLLIRAGREGAVLA